MQCCVQGTARATQKLTVFPTVLDGNPYVEVARLNLSNPSDTGRTVLVNVTSAFARSGPGLSALKLELRENGDTVLDSVETAFAPSTGSFAVGAFALPASLFRGINSGDGMTAVVYLRGESAEEGLNYETTADSSESASLPDMLNLTLQAAVV